MNTRKLKRQRIVLDIVYDDSTGVEQPSHWKWSELLDIGEAETVGVEAWTPVEDCEETEAGAIIGETPYFEQSNAVTLFGAVGVLQRDPATQNEYTLHGTATYINLTQGQNACVFISQAEGGVVVQLLDTSAPPIMEVYREFEVERHEFIDDSGDAAGE